MTRLNVRIERTYSTGSADYAPWNGVRTAQVLLWNDTQAVTFHVDMRTSVIGWADDWSVDGSVFQYGRNYGPGSFGHTDVVLADEYMAKVIALVAPQPSFVPQHY